jgi:hypothetical protein
MMERDPVDRLGEGGSGLFHAIVRIASWGEGSGLINRLKSKDEVYSIFHIMGGTSYLLDVFCRDRLHLRDLILEIKGYPLGHPAQVPVVRTLTTQKILKVFKSSREFNITHYLGDRIYGFMWVNNLRHDDGFLGQVLDDPLIKSILYLQGRYVFLLEFMAHLDDEVFHLIRRVKGTESVAGTETQEVLSIIKYRGVLQEAPTAPPRFILPVAETGEIITI